MSLINLPSQPIVNLIDAAHQERQEPPRPHLGCSTLGHHCDRWLWLSFRWAVVEKFDGRILRLFRRGHLEEPQIISDLRSIGIDIDGSQDHVDFGSHVSGSVDGVIHHGVPTAENTPHVAEFKTHSKKSFTDLKKGVQESKPMHYVQMQVYMLGLKLKRALYVAVCKDDDHMYTERVRFDIDVAKKAVARGKRIALSDRMPEPCTGASKAWYLCKFCAAYSFCHENEPTQQGNCRTCAHATAKADSTWRCERHNSENIPLDYQRTGCDSHTIHPDLVPYQRKEADSQWEAIYVINGKDVLNGEAGYSGQEIIANPSLCASGDADELRTSFNGRIVE
tara:strand:- start:5840 stop:6847 length:1008 start_codon:yes stop_codon:yes gene_type:complete